MVQHLYGAQLHDDVNSLDCHKVYSSLGIQFFYSGELSIGCTVFLHRCCQPIWTVDIGHVDTFLKPCPEH